MCQESGAVTTEARTRGRTLGGVPAKTIRAPKGERTVSATSPNVRERANVKRPGAQCIPAVSRESRPKRGRKSYFRVTFCIMGMASSQVMPLSMNMRTVVLHGATVNM